MAMSIGCLCFGKEYCTVVLVCLLSTTFACASMRRCFEVDVKESCIFSATVPTGNEPSLCKSCTMSNRRLFPSARNIRSVSVVLFLSPNNIVFSIV